MSLTPIRPEDVERYPRLVTDENVHNRGPFKPRSGELRADVIDTGADGGAVVRFHCKYGLSPYTRMVMVGEDGNVIMESVLDCAIEEYERVAAEHPYWVDEDSDTTYRGVLVGLAHRDGMGQYMGRSAVA